jgi:hypothetical protein
MARIGAPAYRCSMRFTPHSSFVGLAGIAMLGAIVLVIERPLHNLLIGAGLFAAGAAYVVFTIFYYRNGGTDAQGS